VVNDVGGGRRSEDRDSDAGAMDGIAKTGRAAPVDVEEGVGEEVGGWKATGGGARSEGDERVLGASPA
jgi:hypothetical protein